MFKQITGFSTLCCCAVTLSAGTLIMKEGDKISGIKIISLESGKITVEKDNTKRTVPLNKVKGYYDTDLKSEDGTVEDLADYKISVEVKAPEKGTGKEKSKNKSKSSRPVPEKFEFSYHITKVGENTKSSKIKAPYFYLYVLFSGGDDEYGRRPMKVYLYPKNVKIKTKSKDEIPDRASIIAALSDFKRPTINLDNLSTDNKLNNTKVEIELKGAPADRKILAWHLEVYGNQDLILEKNEKSLNERVPNEDWWKSY